MADCMKQTPNRRTGSAPRAAGRVGNRYALRALLACAVLTQLPGCGGGDEEEIVEIRPVRVITIADRASNGSVTLTGTVQAQTEINQSFRIDGRMIERMVDVGDKVEPGQLVARLDPQNEESALQSVRAQLTAAQAQLVEARSNHARMRDLVAEDAVSRASFDQAVAMLKTAEAQVESMQSQVRLAENRLSYTRLVSDVAGVVTGRGPEPGEVVAAGRMIVQVAREGGRDAVFGVPAQIKDNAPADPQITVALISDPGVTAAGRIREISPRADPVTGTFAVRVGLVDPPAAMRLGSTVTGRLQFGASIGIELPATALVRSEGSSAVWVVDPEEQTVSLRTIQVQAQDPANVQVISGLANGDTVVTAGVHALRPGQQVRPLEASTL
jgi:RND family efflux transporter MFP subunit